MGGYIISLISICSQTYFCLSPERNKINVCTGNLSTWVQWNFLPTGWLFVYEKNQSFPVTFKMKKTVLILILFVNYAVCLKVISSFTDFERASNANIKGTLHRNKSHQSIEDLSLCIRFLAFFKQKITIGSYKYNFMIKTSVRALVGNPFR